jgi:hypothetical protein
MTAFCFGVYKVNDSKNRAGSSFFFFSIEPSPYQKVLDIQSVVTDELFSEHFREGREFTRVPNGHEENIRGRGKPCTSSLNMCPEACCRKGRVGRSNVSLSSLHPLSSAEPVFVDVYGHLGIDSKNRFRMKN